MPTSLMPAWTRYVAALGRQVDEVLLERGLPQQARDPRLEQDADVVAQVQRLQVGALDRLASA